MQGTFATATTLFDEKDYKQSLAKYQQVVSECNRLVTLDSERRPARQAQSQAISAQAAARSAGAKADASALWSGAEGMAAQAQTVQAEGRFAEAVRLWRAAEGAYGKARAFAEGLGAVRKAKVRYEGELAKHDQASLRTYGGSKWTQVVEQVGRAKAAGEDHAKAVAAYEEATRSLAAAASAAEAGRKKAQLARRNRPSPTTKPAPSRGGTSHAWAQAMEARKAASAKGKATSRPAKKKGLAQQEIIDRWRKAMSNSAGSP